MTFLGAHSTDVVQHKDLRRAILNLDDHFRTQIARIIDEKYHASHVARTDNDAADYKDNKPRIDADRDLFNMGQFEKTCHRFQEKHHNGNQYTETGTSFFRGHAPMWLGNGA